MKNEENIRKIIYENRNVDFFYLGTLINVVGQKNYVKSHSKKLKSIHFPKNKLPVEHYCQIKPLVDHNDLHQTHNFNTSIIIIIPYTPNRTLQFSEAHLTYKYIIIRIVATTALLCLNSFVSRTLVTT